MSNPWRIQMFLGEAGFSTIVARRKTASQLEGLGGPVSPPHGVWGQSPRKSWLFSILWCSKHRFRDCLWRETVTKTYFRNQGKGKQNTIYQGFEIIADLHNYMKEPF